MSEDHPAADSRVLRWPAQTDYQQAVLNPASCFTDPELQRSTPVDFLPYGLPRPISGQFANIYQMRLTSGARVAVRLFLSPQADRGARYAALDTWLVGLGASAPPSLVRYVYQPQGFVFSGRRLPLLLLDWIDGIPLSEFVEQHLQEPHRLLALAERWNELTRSLSAAQIAHGDLQHGNILVETGPEDRLRLIDYDGMWVPSLAGIAGCEAGHRAYRHRDRRPDSFGPDMDRLPALVIYTSLRALAVAPDIWYRLHDGDNLIFHEEDLAAPQWGRAFQVLAEKRGIDRETARVIQQLRQAAEGWYPGY